MKESLKQRNLGLGTVFNSVEFCDRCGDAMDSYYMVNGKEVCEYCVYFDNPPTLVLIKTARSDLKLYNSVKNRYEMYMGMEQFIRCGWFIREKEILKDSTIYRLEYHGHIMCKRCKEWLKKNDFPEDFITCKAQICNNYI